LCFWKLAAGSEALLSLTYTAWSIHGHCSQGSLHEVIKAAGLERAAVVTIAKEKTQGNLSQTHDRANETESEQPIQLPTWR